jgi:drug/metabolite transporter (DMT)-like permease
MTNKLRSDLLLLLAAIIWGFAFVAQRSGMSYMGPFTFNGIRFTMGAVVLLPFLLRRRKEMLLFPDEKNPRRKLLAGIIATGLILFLGAAFQQSGIQHTTAGKAGFITGLYVVFVPVVGLAFGQKTRLMVWAGMLFAATGLYFLSIKSGFTMAPGDFLVFLCAVTFTFHVLIVGWLSPRTDTFLLAVIQFGICGIINLILAFSFETIIWSSIAQAWMILLYGGLLSVGVGFTLQVFAQKSAHPAYVSIILSLESVFAAFGGWLLLGEILTLRQMAGCLLMLTGMIIVQRKG